MTGRAVTAAPVEVGGALTPGALLAAHRRGLFPMPAEAGPPTWWSPDPRPVLTFDSVHLGRGLAKTLCARRGWTTTVDRAFHPVLAACRAGREPRWLTDELVSAMAELFADGWYHSVEVWSGAELVGGAVGLGAGAVFSADTMFHAQSGASRIALADLCARLADAGRPVVDLQSDSPHARQLGAVLLDRREYEALAGAGEDRIAALPAEERTVDDLLARLRARSRA